MIDLPPELRAACARDNTSLWNTSCSMLMLPSGSLEVEVLPVSALVVEVSRSLLVELLVEDALVRSMATSRNSVRLALQMLAREGLVDAVDVFCDRIAFSLAEKGWAQLDSAARVARTAGPLLELSVRNWMPAASAALAMTPPRASISRTR